MLQVSFAPYVGTSPGTTTLGQCPPGWYGQAIMLPGTIPAPLSVPGGEPIMKPVTVDPYGTDSKLRGLGATAIRWDLLVLSFGAAFAGVLGWFWYRSKHKR